MAGLGFGLMFQWCFRGGGGGVVVWLVWCFLVVGLVVLVFQ